MSIRPNPAGQDPKITWGFLGKLKTYKNSAYKEQKNLTIEERFEALNKSKKPYNSEDFEGRIIVVGGGGVYQQTTPTPSPTPTMTPTPSSTPIPSFNPSSLGDLQLWFDADDSSTLSLVGGNTVDTWTSKGLLDVVMSAPTTERRPGYTTTGGQGGNSAVVIYSSSTAANRSGLLSVDSTKSLDLSTGYTHFIVGKNIGTKTTANLYNSTSLLSMWNTGGTGTYSSKLLLYQSRVTQDYLQTGATTGVINQYSAYANASAFTQASDYVLNSLVVDYTDLYPGKYYGKNIVSGNTINASLTTSGMTTFTGKTVNTYGIVSTKYTGTETNTNTNPFEIYEILLYNKVLSPSQINQVENYLRNKWEYTADTSNLAVVNVNYTGKTNTASQYLRVLASPTLQVNAQMAWDNYNDIVILPVDNTITFDNTAFTAGVGINYTLKDGSNNTILSQLCYDTTDKTITLSAGTYTFDGNIDYACAQPTPTMTPTPSITPTYTPTPEPTPSPTPTIYYQYADNFFNLTGDSTSRFSLIQDSNSQVWFDISGVTTTGFTLNLPPESFTLEYSNTNGNYMNFEGYPADCNTGLPSGSPLYTNYCTSVNNQNWGMGGICYYFNMYADTASCIPTPTPTNTPTYTPTPSVTPTYTPTMTSSPVPISLTYISNTINTANQSSYTFSSVSTGVGLIAVVVNGSAAYNSGRDFTGATIGGVAASVVHSGVANGGPSLGNTSIQALIYAVVTGSTNDIVVNFNGSVFNAAISCWRVENYTSTTPFYSDGYVNNNNNTEMNRTTSSLSGKNVCLAGCIVGDGGMGNNTWTNATERYDIQLEAGLPKITGADFTTTSSGAVTVTCSYPALNNRGAVFSIAVWK
jgi:hypothetical protein